MTYLRISLTDRCNFRCVYCMPASGMQFQPRDELLTDDELLRVVRIAAESGFRKLRLTGGEPTVRPHLVDLVREMKRMPGIEEISMTTNGLILSRVAEPLAAAGLNRVNVSIDTLDPARFKFMTRGGRLQLVWQGIEAAEQAGLTPIKLNTVVLKGQNDEQVVEMASLTLEHPWQVRFLEIMPLEGVGDVHDQGLVTSEMTKARLEEQFGALEPVDTDPSDPARLWRIPGAPGTIGFISPVSQPF
jgi:cyclic pyranopterin phosphate synthase